MVILECQETLTVVTVKFYPAYLFHFSIGINGPIIAIAMVPPTMVCTRGISTVLRLSIIEQNEVRFT